MYKDMLPNGSVVSLKDGEHYLMIIGRILSDETASEIYDYGACLFPEGLSDFDEIYFFNRDDIKEVSFVGFQDENELSFRHEFLDKLGKLTVKNGAIVPEN